jgi:hypothetical protein
VHDNLGAIDVVSQLNDEVMAAIESLLGNKPEQPEF